LLGLDMSGLLGQRAEGTHRGRGPQAAVRSIVPSYPLTGRLPAVTGGRPAIPAELLVLNPCRLS
jgi:hypothetical protein